MSQVLVLKIWQTQKEEITGWLEKLDILFKFQHTAERGEGNF